MLFLYIYTWFKLLQWSYLFKLISYNKRKHTDNFMNTSDNHILVYIDKSPYTIEIATKCVHLLNITRQGTQNQKENRRIFHHFMKKLV